jgi:MFS family permease
MPNSDAEYPFHQPQGGRHHDPFGADTEADDVGQVRDAGKPPRPRYQTRGPFHQRDAPTSPQLPPHHMRNTLITGLIAGIVGALQSFIIVLVNAPIYNSAKDKAQGSLTLNLAGPIFGLFCLMIFIGLLIYFVAGFITGKIAVSRRLGFLAGFVAGIVTAIINYFIHQLPQYPDTTTRGSIGGSGGIIGGLIVGLIVLVLIGLVSGCVSYLGARIATRRHVYYTGYEE